MDKAKKCGELIKSLITQGLHPREAIPRALNDIGIKLSPISLEYLITVHEREIDRLKGLQIQAKTDKIAVPHPDLIVVVTDGGSYAKALKQIKEEK